MQRALFALGIIISLVGLAWPWISKLPLGRLPGDFLIERPGLRLFLPFTTMIVISVRPWNWFRTTPEPIETSAEPVAVDSHI